MYIYIYIYIYIYTVMYTCRMQYNYVINNISKQIVSLTRHVHLVNTLICYIRL